MISMLLYDVLLDAVLKGIIGSMCVQMHKQGGFQADVKW